MAEERDRKDDPVEGSREVIDEELKKQAEQQPARTAEDQAAGEAGHHPTDAELGPKGIP